MKIMFLPMMRYKSANGDWRICACSDARETQEQAEIVAQDMTRSIQQGMTWIVTIPVPDYMPPLKLAKVSSNAK